MAFRVHIHREADAEIEQAMLWIASDSVDRAIAWFNQLTEVIESLKQYPERCPLAPESSRFGEEIRQHLHGPYRIIFRIRGKAVEILHVRHGARKPLK